jgi:hypothetical protein
MKRLITIILATALATGSVVAVFMAPAVAGGCTTRSHTSSTMPAPNMVWIPDNHAHRVGHFFTQAGCGRIWYTARGQRYEGMASTNVRLIWYNSMHHWRSTGPWLTAHPSQGSILLDGFVGAGAEFSFECQDTRPAQRRPDLWCLYTVGF